MNVYFMRLIIEREENKGTEQQCSEPGRPNNIVKMKRGKKL